MARPTVLGGVTCWFASRGCNEVKWDWSCLVCQ